MPSDPTYVRSTKLHRVNAAARMLDVSRPTNYGLVRAGELMLVKIGKRASAIAGDSLRDFIAARSRPEGDGNQTGSRRGFWRGKPAGEPRQTRLPGCDALSATSCSC